MNFLLLQAFLLKLPYDLSKLVAIRADELSDWTSLLIQSAVMVACFHHYGLVKAVWNTIQGKESIFKIGK